MSSSAGSIDPDDSDAPGEDPSRPRPGSPAWTPRRTAQLVALALVLVALTGAALAFRAHHRQQVVAQGLARAERTMALDTQASYADAARLLEPLAVLDPVNAGAARAFALAMLASDYRDRSAASAAEPLLAESAAQERPPAWSELALTMLAVSRGEAGSALASASRAGEGPWARVAQARVALLASKPELAREPLDAAVQSQPRFAPALALRGDVLRRTGHAAQAADSYRAALAASPLQPRATYGLAKLALSGAVSPDEARAALDRLMGDTTATPDVERARAAYLAAAIEARAGNRMGASAAMDRAGVPAGARAWMERSVDALASSAVYAVQDGAPPELRSASDDDPYVPPPRPPPSSAISPTFRLPERPVPPPRAAAVPRRSAHVAPKPPASKPKRAQPAKKPTATARTKAKAKTTPHRAR